MKDSEVSAKWRWNGPWRPNDGASHFGA